MLISPEEVLKKVPTKLYINGKWISGIHKKLFPVYNPGKGELLLNVESASVEDVDLAVEAAKSALIEGDWSHFSAIQRFKAMISISDAILARKEELATIETLNNGKPFRDSLGDVLETVACFKYFANKALELERIQGEYIDTETEGYKSRIYYEPLGVAGLIVPFNFPLMMTAWKVAPCLASGCTAILKPSEFTPLSALLLADIINGLQVLPPGVFNVINGFGHDTGESLVLHKDVNKIAFTGSVATGRRVAKLCGEELKFCTLELGGKSALILLEDICNDEILLKKAVDWILYGIFGNQGEVCSATSRLLVDEKWKERVLELLIEKTKTIKTGYGLEPDVQIGAIVSESQYKKVLRYIETGIEEGAKIVIGGPGKLQGLTYSSGYYVEPTIFTEVSSSMKIWREEIFGPVLCVMGFKTEDEAIHIANSSEFGLAGAVFTKNIEKFKNISSKLRVGTCWGNCSQPCFNSVPFGGYKHSGIGRELGGLNALKNYLQVKAVIENDGGVTCEFFK